MDFAKIKQDVYALFMRDNLLEGFSRTFRDEDDPNNFIAVTCERNGLLLNMYISFNGSRIIRRNVFGCFWRQGIFFKNGTFILGVLDDLGYCVSYDSSVSHEHWQKTL